MPGDHRGQRKALEVELQMVVSSHVCAGAITEPGLSSYNRRIISKLKKVIAIVKHHDPCFLDWEQGKECEKCSLSLL